ncbi:hypothetical protein [Streptomyces hawaiiensis]|uniref:Uncharacterized protein n=1 Tax=Streptomyces hawaiiensis TaxID=67305 RepID=A0A6G5RDY0_9ACTN|nr:hypothetical protein [Streptomyces hawaiiensis]QCD56353.1 hypothetical protein CEB94_16900 [Streptomyces hawaiiensis]
MLEGVLIAESLRVGAEPAGVPLRVTKITRVAVEGAAAGQPGQWTLLDFADAERPAERPADCLAPAGGWYVNYNTGTEAFVVFAGRVFRYPRRQTEGRLPAQRYARSLGIPEAQLDWED